MAGYLNQNGNSIGSLLRFIQEQKSQSPMVPPATDTGSPIRAMTQEPLKGPEAQDTSRVVSIKPEAVISPSGQTQSAVAPGIESMGSIAPAGPVAPSMTPTIMGEKRSAVASPQPSIQSSQPSQPSQPSMRPTSIATKITPSTNIPTRSTVGPLVLVPMEPTKPQKVNVSQQGSATVYKQTGSTVPYPTTGPTPAPTSNRFLPPVNVNKPAAPSLGTILSGGIGQAWKKLFGR